VRAPRSRRTRAVISTAAAAIAAAAFAGPASANLSVTGPVSPATGFPAWYQDANGTQLELCIADPLCPASPPAADFKAPDGEAFYQLASATATGPDGQEVTVDFNIEAAFLDADPITFGRIQVTLKGMEPNSDYTITHPYGTGTWTSDANGELLGGDRTRQRLEVGCPAAPCNFDDALGTSIGPFMQWDPAVAPAAPAGYIGDGVTPHEIVGPATTFVKVEGPGLPVGGISTNLFTIEGKRASAPAPIFFAAPGSGSFGTQRVGTTVNRTVTIKNNGLADMALGATTVSGTDFAKGADTCANGTIASGATCTIDVAFSPAAAAARSGSLVVEGGGTVPLSGTGGVPGVASSPTVVNFLNQNVSTTSAEQSLTISNTGAVALNISNAAITGANAAEFAVTRNGCAAVPAGGSCTIALKFLPAAAGVRNATLVLTSDAPGSPHSVPLTGSGTVPPGAGGGGGVPPAGGGAAATPPAQVVPGPTQTIVVQRPGVAVQGTTQTGAAPRLGLQDLLPVGRLTQAQLRAQGLRLRMQLEDGTRVVRVSIFRAKRNGQRTGRPVFTTVRGVKATTTRITLRNRAVKRLKAGRYVARIQPGRSRADRSGVSSSVGFTVR
jgi:hypothetical protein